MMRTELVDFVCHVRAPWLDSLSETKLSTAEVNGIDLAIFETDMDNLVDFWCWKKCARLIGSHNVLSDLLYRDNGLFDGNAFVFKLSATLQARVREQLIAVTDLSTKLSPSHA